MAFTLSKETAGRVVGLVNFFTDLDGAPAVARALHECNVQLTALGPYRDRALERTRDALAYIADRPADQHARLLDQAAAIRDGAR